MKPSTSPELLPIAVRAYANRTEEPKQKKPSNSVGIAPLEASEWTLVFDTETTTDAAQRLRFGVYQVRKAGVLRKSGIFYDPATIAGDELSLLREYTHNRAFEVITVERFVKQVFFRYAYDLRALCVGFNLPFDLSRIAIGHDSARGKMRGGFSLQLAEDKRRSRVQIKHLSNRSALIRFTVPPKQRTVGNQRKKGYWVPPHRGYFVDARTLAGALLGGSWSLKDLAEHLKTEHRKLGTDEYGGPLTEEFLEYAEQDVQVTWECFERLNKQYESYGLTQTLVDKIYSEASLGKAYLKEMGIRTWQELQPNFPPELLGIIMSTYYGGRSEVHIRREVVQVLYCDFLSMYPTVCTLMGLWRFVIAERMEWQDATAEIQEFLKRVTLEDLQKPEIWPMLCALVRVQPDDDIFPVRGKYGSENQYTIGINRFTSDEIHWYTLADCIASKILKGKTPKVLRAVRFYPADIQTSLQPINIAGNPDYRVDPQKDDFYKRLIDLRSEVKANRDGAKKAGYKAEATKLDAEQKALKLCANATSYGIFVELNVTERDKTEEMMCYGPSGEGFTTRARNVEEPGRYFHPLLGTLITGAARLMLAIAERLSEDAGISWAFCDTDSMALAKPGGMNDAEFLERAERVRGWFTPLNPYEHKAELFKVEDANKRLKRGKITEEIEPLYCLAVSAKRYVLFNLDQRGRPVLRKVSAHGLGHLLPPYEEEQAPKKIPKPIIPLRDLGGAERWQYDLWYRIVEAALGDNPEQVKLDDLSGFERSAVSRYAATTPTLLRWFEEYNRGKPYREHVKPFNFLLAYQGNPISGEAALKPVSTYDENSKKASEDCFDRTTGEPVPPQYLRSCREALAQYHLHPEAKFLGGNYLDAGPTRRRHVVATAAEHIGKEANRWEEQFHLGRDHEAQIEYGNAPEDQERILGIVKRAGEKFGQRALAKVAGVSLREVSMAVRGEWKPSNTTLAKLYWAVPQLEAACRGQAEYTQKVLDGVREYCQRVSMRRLASEADMDAANLAHVLSGRREPSRAMLTKLEAALSSKRRSDGCLKSRKSTTSITASSL